MRMVAVVLKSGQDLREAIEEVVGKHKISAGTIIDITAELVIAVEDSLRFTEKYDEAVGWNNLVIEKN